MDHPTSPPASVVACGLYGAGNLGDDLLMEVMALAIGDAGLTAVLGAYDLDVARAMTGCRAVPAPRLSPRLPLLIRDFAREVSRSRAVLLGGGGLFQDTHSAFTVAEYALTAAIASTLGRPLVVWGVGLGPFRYRLNEALTRAVLSLAATLTVRDQESARISGRPSDTTVVEDPVWWLSRVGLASDPSPADGPVAFVFREWPGLSVEAAAGLVQRVCAPIGAEAVLLPFEYSGTLPRDWRFSDLIASRCRELGVRASVPLSPEYPSPEDVRSALRRCRALLTMRFHGAILGITEGVPVIAFDCVPKLVHLFGEVGLRERIVGLSQIGAAAPISAVTAVLADRQGAFAAQRAPFANRPERRGTLQEALRDVPPPAWPTRVRGVLILATSLALLAVGAVVAAAAKARRALASR